MTFGAVHIDNKKITFISDKKITDLTVPVQKTKKLGICLVSFAGTWTIWFSIQELNLFDKELTFDRVQEINNALLGFWGFIDKIDYSLLISDGKNVWKISKQLAPIKCEDKKYLCHGSSCVEPTLITCIQSVQDSAINIMKKALEIASSIAPEYISTEFDINEL